MVVVIQEAPNGEPEFQIQPDSPEFQAERKTWGLEKHRQLIGAFRTEIPLSWLGRAETRFLEDQTNSNRGELSLNFRLPADFHLEWEVEHFGLSENVFGVNSHPLLKGISEALAGRDFSENQNSRLFVEMDQDRGPRDIELAVSFDINQKGLPELDLDSLSVSADFFDRTWLNTIRFQFIEGSEELFLDRALYAADFSKALEEQFPKLLPVAWELLGTQGQAQVQESLQTYFSGWISNFSVDIPMPLLMSEDRPLKLRVLDAVLPKESFHLEFRELSEDERKKLGSIDLSSLPGDLEIKKDHPESLSFVTRVQLPERIRARLQNLWIPGNEVDLLELSLSQPKVPEVLIEWKMVPDVEKGYILIPMASNLEEVLMGYELVEEGPDAPVGRGIRGGKNRLERAGISTLNILRNTGFAGGALGGILQGQVNRIEGLPPQVELVTRGVTGSGFLLAGALTDVEQDFLRKAVAKTIQEKKPEFVPRAWEILLEQLNGRWSELPVGETSLVPLSPAAALQGFAELADSPRKDFIGESSRIAFQEIDTAEPEPKDPKNGLVPDFFDLLRRQFLKIVEDKMIPWDRPLGEIPAKSPEGVDITARELVETTGQEQAARLLSEQDLSGQMGQVFSSLREKLTGIIQSLPQTLDPSDNLENRKLRERQAALEASGELPEIGPSQEIPEASPIDLFGILQTTLDGFAEPISRDLVQQIRELSLAEIMMRSQQSSAEEEAPSESPTGLGLDYLMPGVCELPELDLVFEEAENQLNLPVLIGNRPRDPKPVLPPPAPPGGNPKSSPPTPQVKIGGPAQIFPLGEASIRYQVLDDYIARVTPHLEETLRDMVRYSDPLDKNKTRLGVSEKFNIRILEPRIDFEQGLAVVRFGLQSKQGGLFKIENEVEVQIPMRLEVYNTFLDRPENPQQVPQHQYELRFSVDPRWIASEGGGYFAQNLSDTKPGLDRLYGNTLEKEIRNFFLTQEGKRVLGGTDVIIPIPTVGVPGFAILDENGKPVGASDVEIALDSPIFGEKGIQIPVSLVVRHKEGVPAATEYQKMTIEFPKP
jgi:hypothetical protein